MNKNKSSIGRKYGWKPQKPDARDKKFKKVKLLRAITLPSSVDLRENMPEVCDQSTLGSCVANAIGSGHQFEQIKQKLPDIWQPSRLFIYYGAREIDGNIDIDSGAEIRDGIKFVAKVGVCPEYMWEYNINKFTEKPPSKCYDIAAAHTVANYMALDNTDINQLKLCLAEGYPFTFGFTVYESFESPEVASTGIMPIPKKDEVTMGGHAVLAVGYLDSIKCFIIRNSWGKNWGKDGYFYMPYSVMTNPGLTADFWTIRLVNDDGIGPNSVQKTTKSFWQRLFGWL